MFPSMTLIEELVYCTIYSLCITNCIVTCNKWTQEKRNEEFEQRFLSLETKLGSIAMER